MCVTVSHTRFVKTQKTLTGFTLNEWDHFLGSKKEDHFKGAKG